MKITIDEVKYVAGLARLELKPEEAEAMAGQLDKTPHQVRALCHKAVEQIRSLLNNKSPGRHRKEESHVQD